LGYANADVFLICFSIGDKESFKSVVGKWLYELRTNAPSVPIILVATKIDLRNDIPLEKSVTSEEGAECQ
jgi:GTPase SAR1 family protein